MAKTSVLFSINDKVGGLEEVLGIFKSFNLSLTRIESRPSRTKDWDYDFFVDFSETTPSEKVEKLLAELQKRGIGVNSSLSGHSGLGTSQKLQSIEWFPRKISDLDEFAHKTLEMGEDLSADHPGFNDESYRKRRTYIVEVAKKYKHGEKIPRIDYTKEEIETWGVVWKRLTQLYPTHACRAFNYILPLLIQNCGYGPDRIPQLQDVSDFLQECTGFRLRPVQGLLTARDFLNGLAFRVFHSTQYIRHPSKPFYTPEPDVCHELLGHVPLFCDPDFADFSQEIGLASLGASDEDIEKLATVYWFTVEFGLCKEDGGVKAFGAGLLSSFGELEYCLTEKPQVLPFIPEKAAVTQYPITTYQPLYFVTESFHHAKTQIIKYAETLNRTFTIRYNPYTQRVEILDTKPKICQYVKEIQAQMSNLAQAISKLPIGDQ